MRCTAVWNQRSLTIGALGLLLAAAAPAITAAHIAAQVPVQQSASLGSVGGKVVDERGMPIPGAQIIVESSGRSTRSRAEGDFLLPNVAPGRTTVRAMMIGYRMQAATVAVDAGRRTEQQFRMERDPLRLGAMVVTGTQSTVSNMDASVAITTLTPQLIQQSSPRSTTEMLRYVPGFTRIESSGGEVNQNISMRGILGVEYVMFMEDGMPVFPTMHTYFMNADNLFRPDENIETMEVVRGGSSALFGASTPGAIINFINKTGGAEIAGTMKASAATGGLARYDFNVNGPLSEDWHFNLGGFYRYDRGIRNPGFPGIAGGQLKGSLTRSLDKGYIRATAKLIDDRNQFILPLPFTNPGSPRYVPGFSDYGSMNSNEGNHISVPTPGGGRLELPLEDGLRTRAGWFTVDAAFEPSPGWKIQNTAQTMADQQAWNAIVPSDVVPAADWVNNYIVSTLGLPANTPYQLFFTNVKDAAGNRVPFNTGNALISPAGEWHVDKPLKAFQNQLQLRRSGDRYNVNAGVYFANYSQTNHWFFTDILTNVADQTNFLDLVVRPGATPINVTQNGFRSYTSNYVNGDGQTTVSSGTIGGDVHVTDKLKLNGGLRYEFDSYVQTVENTGPVDLDNTPATRYNNVTWGNGTFRHFSHRMEASAVSLGANYSLSRNLALYAQYGRAFKMPALDDFLNATSADQVNLFAPQRTKMYEGGVKFSSGGYGLAANLFHAELRNITSQGAEVIGGVTQWVTRHQPETQSDGLELEASGSPVDRLQLLGSGTFLKAKFATGADIGSLLNGVPKFIGNASARYGVTRKLDVIGDVHYVGKRYSDYKTGVSLQQYTYFNFGAAYQFTPRGLTISADVLNALQSKGLEEGNARLTSVGGRTNENFLARPLLPRRLLVSMRYDY